MVWGLDLCEAKLYTGEKSGLSLSSRKNIRYLLPTHRFASSLAASKSNGSTSSTSCDVEKLNVPDLGSSKEAASILRSATLSNVNGETVRLGDYMGTETSIIIFLRHLA